MAFDMHTHSNLSDGTTSPADVVRAAADAGLEGVAITDHDTTAGWEPAEEAAQEHQIALIRGMELSTVSREGIAVHVLSYLHDPTNLELLAEIAKSRNARYKRAKRMAMLLSADFPITWELVKAQTTVESTIGRPHLADALVQIGAVPNRSAAFDTILRGGSKYYVPHYAPDPVLGVELIRKAGGVPIFAHPMAKVRGRTVSKRLFDEMLDAGLAGVEVYHRDNSGSGKEWLLEFARRHNLLVTGSSDYHGTGKPNRLGEHVTSRETVEAIEAQATSGYKVLWNGV
ncbi:MAG TPA: PHP domain-containing protein [Enteractinococcus helveticum]|uniref:PHP domain-containing protein n=1 Tax=Enteractinococcus helveticum TaxID=1837282 RepID=A0A921FMH2_9MICC|nr:PHP domain-containing protein [Enteractinococcus helveticum]HJF14369.1 PHP domain-containing protein [Enteractinococcus helveticum]